MGKRNVDSASSLSGADREQKHTPGPWEIEESARVINENCGVIYERLDYVVFKTDGVDIGIVYRLEDAHLVVAAPDVLEALKMCLAQLEILLPSTGRTHDERQALIAANAAIAKAEGR